MSLPDRIRNLHVGQVILLGVIFFLVEMAIGVGLPAATDAYDSAAREVSGLERELAALSAPTPRPPGVNVGSVQDTTLMGTLSWLQRIFSENEAAERISQARERLPSAREESRRFLVLSIGLGALGLLALPAYLSVLWIWFGGRRMPV